MKKIPWFRKGAVICITICFFVALMLCIVTLHMLTNRSHARAMDADPEYNGTLAIYILILVYQIAILILSGVGWNVSYHNWKNNWQMDRGVRRETIMLLSFWGFVMLLNLGQGIYCIVRGKNPEEDMAYLYEVFTRANQDIRFVSNFERYQRENQCCGVYGPDDWLLVQLKSNMGGGGGGGGFQSLDYGYRQNPSTGHCHLLPPTIPSGCGRKMLEEIRLQLTIYASMMIIQTIIGTMAGSLAGYSLFYWLDNEVLVIPADEVSNLIIVEVDEDESVEGDGETGGAQPPTDPPPDVDPDGNIHQGRSKKTKRAGGGYLHAPPVYGGYMVSDAGSSPGSNPGGGGFSGSVKGSGGVSGSNGGSASSANAGSVPSGSGSSGGGSHKSRSSGSHKSGSGRSKQSGSGGPSRTHPSASVRSSARGSGSAAERPSSGRRSASVRSGNPSGRIPQPDHSSRGLTPSPPPEDFEFPVTLVGVDSNRNRNRSTSRYIYRASSRASGVNSIASSNRSRASIERGRRTKVYVKK